MMCHFSLAAFKTFLTLVFKCLLCAFGMGFLRFILLELRSASWNCRCVSFTRFGKFSFSFFFSIFPRTLTIEMVSLSLSVHRSLRLIFYLSLFSHCYSCWMSYIAFPSSSLVLPYFIIHLHSSIELI